MSGAPFLSSGATIVGEFSAELVDAKGLRALEHQARNVYTKYDDLLLGIEDARLRRGIMDGSLHYKPEGVSQELAEQDDRHKKEYYAMQFDTSGDEEVLEAAIRTPDQSVIGATMQRDEENTGYKASRARVSCARQQ